VEVESAEKGRMIKRDLPGQQKGHKSKGRDELSLKKTTGSVVEKWSQNCRGRKRDA